MGVEQKVSANTELQALSLWDQGLTAQASQNLSTKHDETDDYLITEQHGERYYFFSCSSSAAESAHLSPKLRRQIYE